jgi:hypothetical protein
MLAPGAGFARNCLAITLYSCPEAPESTIFLPTGGGLMPILFIVVTMVMVAGTGFARADWDPVGNVR